MKVGIYVAIAIFTFTLINCKKTNPTNLTKTENKQDSIPRYDSLDWSQAYQFQPFDLKDLSNKYQILDKFYTDFWVHNKVSGGFLVAQHGKIIYEKYTGFSYFENQIPMNAETPLHIASISKVLTSLAILKLVEFKKLKLNDRVDQYLSGFPYEKVRIEDLLNHRSGLPNYLYLSEDKKYWDQEKMMTNEDVLQMLIDKKPPLFTEPGTHFAYNNTNFVLLALIIEKITGKKYPQAMKYMVFEPLGMTHTFVMEFDKDSATVSKSYYFNGRNWKYDHLDKTYGDKNIYSTPRDLFKMDVAMYSDKFLPKKLKEKAWKGYSYEKEGVKNYGLGMRLMEWEDGKKILYHNGLWHGNNATYVRDFDNEATIIALGNRKNRTIYSTFRLVEIFGDYPFKIEQPEESEPKNTADSINNFQQHIDSVKQKVKSDKVEHTQKKLDSLKTKNQSNKEKLDKKKN